MNIYVRNTEDFEMMASYKSDALPNVGEHIKIDETYYVVSSRIYYVNGNVELRVMEYITEYKKK